MSLDWMAQLIRQDGDAPDADTALRILEAAEQDEALRLLVREALLSRRPWSMRLAAIAMNRFAAAFTEDRDPDLPELIFALAAAVAEVGDDAAMQTCLNAMKWLIETQRLHPLEDQDRQSVLQLLWRSLDSDVANTRESGLDTLTSIHDFGDLVELLGQDRVRELRRWVHEARAEAPDAEAAEDLASAERLLP